MAKRTNCVINGKEYYRTYRKVGMKKNSKGLWVSDRKAFYGACKREAEEEYQKYMERRKSGISTNEKIFGIMAEQYIYNVFIHNMAYANSTKTAYINAFTKHILSGSHIAGSPIEDITSMDIQEVYNNMKCAPAGLRNVHNLMRLFYKYLEREGIMRDLTANLVLPQKKPSKKAQKSSVSDDDGIVVRTDDEMRAIINGLEGHRLKLLVIMAVNTGCRLSELLALRYTDISSEGILTVNKQVVHDLIVEPLEVKNGAPVVSKRQKTMTSARTIPLNESTLREVESHKTWQRIEMMKNGYRTEFIFTTASGKLYDKRNIGRALDRAYRRIGVKPLAFHVYRHTFGTNLCKMGVPIQTASKLLGHKDINMTARYYVNVGMDEKARAVELIAINGV